MAKKDSNGNPLGKSRGLGRKSSGTADWEQANGDLLKKAIATAALTGGCLRLGYSRDGGAYAVGIYGDGEPYTEWLKPSDDLDTFLQDIIVLFESIRDDQMTERKGKKAEK